MLRNLEILKRKADSCGFGKKFYLLGRIEVEKKMKPILTSKCHGIFYVALRCAGNIAAALTPRFAAVNLVLSMISNLCRRASQNF